MNFRPAWRVAASLAAIAFWNTSLSAAEPDSPPHVDTSGVNLQPPYPPMALQNQERGAVVLGVAVTADGRVTRVALIETSGFNDLNASAISTVLGWKFVPARKDGQPVEGATMVKLVFEPPTTQANASSTQPPPSTPSSQPLFPAPWALSAPDGEQQGRNFSVPCRRGSFEGAITIGHDAKRGGEMVSFGVRLSASSESAEFSISHIGARLVGAEITHTTSGAAATGDHYWGSGEMGIPIPISVGWGGGRVTGNGGIVFGQHQVDFAKDPEKLEVSVYSGDVTISNPRLVCTTDHQ